MVYVKNGSIQVVPWGSGRLYKIKWQWPGLNDYKGMKNL